MKNILVLFLIIGSNLLWSQHSIYPNYISTKNSKNTDLEKTDDIYFFHLKPIQYLGEPKNSIEINYNDFDRYNPILKNNYRNPNDTLNKEFNKHTYENIKIFVDTQQSTPIISTNIDYTKITEAEINTELESINEGKKSTREIPKKEIYYDAFPVTIYNTDSKNEKLIGFGNHIPLELEALDKENHWKKVYGFRKYNCGNGIRYIILKPNQIATVFEPRMKGNFSTKFRYTLGNIVSNEFEGSINDNYLKD